MLHKCSVDLGMCRISKYACTCNHLSHEQSFCKSYEMWSEVKNVISYINISLLVSLVCYFIFTANEVVFISSVI